MTRPGCLRHSRESLTKNYYRLDPCERRAAASPPPGRRQHVLLNQREEDGGSPLPCAGGIDRDLSPLEPLVESRHGRQGRAPRCAVTYEPISGSSSPPAGRGSPGAGRAAYVRPATAAECQGCAAPRSPSGSDLTLEYMIKRERGNATGVSDSVIDGLAHSLQLDEAERAHLEDLLRTAGTTRPPRRRPPVSGSAPPPSAHPRRSDRTPALVLNGRLDISPATTSTPRCTHRVYADPARPAIHRPVHLPRPECDRVLPRL
jgi:hypothetical protein